MLTAAIDLSVPGTQHGHLHLIHSDHRHAHSVIPIPITVVSGAPGPTVLITAGVHGDEFAGVLAARQVIAELPTQSITGRVIILPQLNLPACHANTRVSPLDGANLNRVFPGSATGEPTGQIAHYIETVLLPKADYALDLHSGGTTARYAPSAFLYRREGTPMEAKRAAARAFGMCHALVVDAPANAGSLLGACDRCGVPAIACEVGGGATLDAKAIAETRNGIYRVLHHWGVLAEVPRDVAPPVATEFVHFAFGPQNAVITPVSGGLVPLCQPGDVVRAGQGAALLYPMEDQRLPPQTLKHPHDGIVVSLIARAEVQAGDMVCMLGTPEAP